MKRPRIERVPGDYDPRYPRALSREEYERLVAPDQRKRVVAAAAALASMALGPAAAQESSAAGEERLETVLRVLRSGARGSAQWMPRSSFVRQRDRQGNPLVLPSIPVMFGNSSNGLFDAERARQLANQLFTAYGLRPVTDHPTEGVAATIDVYDPVAGVGVELRGGMPDRNVIFSEPAPEPPNELLDDEELARLAEQGIRVQCAELGAYPIMDGDGVTSMLAYLAGVVAFLDEVTGGADIGLVSILDADKVRIALPQPAGAGAEPPDGQAPVELAEETALEFVIDPARGYERAPSGWQLFGRAEWEAIERVPASAGPLLMQVPVATGTPLVVQQDGEPPLRVEAEASLCFLPPGFDPRRPFRVTVRLPAGQHHVGPHLVLYGTGR
jgi:hypothetical protein